jgi:hypothetical protein
MTRWIAACFMIVAAFVVATAQPAKDEKKTIEASVNENKDWVWTLPSEGEMPINDLLTMYIDCRNLVLIYDPKRMAGLTTFRAPDETELTGDQIDLFVANSLSEFRMIVIDAGGGQHKLIPSAEAMTTAPVIDVTQLETAPAWKWIILRYHPVNAEANALRAALQNLTTRQGGVTPMANGELLICDRTDRVRELHKLACEFDASMATEIRAHDVPEGVDADKAIKALVELLGSAQKYRMLQPTFTRSPGETRVLVRGNAELHDEVDTALAAMK